MSDNNSKATQRMTKQRLAVIEALEASNDFRSAQQIHKDMAADGSHVGLATVYRNLQVLSDNGMVEAIRAEEGEYLYRYCEETKHHHHLICRNCNKSVSIAGEAVERFIRRKSIENGFTQVEHSFDLFGLCEECSKLEREQTLKS